MKTPLVEQNNFDIPDEKAATSAWDDYCRSNRSIIVSVFGGQQRSSLKCLSCGKESVTFEPFFNLSLPIPVSVDECSIMVKICIRCPYFCPLFGADCVFWLRRIASSCTRSLSWSVDGPVHSARSAGKPARRLTFGNYLQYLSFTCRGLSLYLSTLGAESHMCFCHRKQSGSTMMGTGRRGSPQSTTASTR